MAQPIPLFVTDQGQQGQINQNNFQPNPNFYGETSIGFQPSNEFNFAGSNDFYQSVPVQPAPTPQQYNQSQLHHRGPQMQPQQPLQPQQGEFFKESLLSMASEAGVPSPLAQMGLNYGSTALDNSIQKVSGSLNQYVSVSSIKYYFDVNTKYVREKLLLLLFPFSKKGGWRRALDNDTVIAAINQSFHTPRYDVFAPDLYIPLMSAITYVLLVGFVKGFQEEFNPELLGSMLSRASVAIFLEVAIIKISLYLLPFSTTCSLLDLMAYCGYIFVGITTNIFIGFCFGWSAYYLSLLWNALCMGWFMNQTFGNILINKEKEESPQNNNNMDFGGPMQFGVIPQAPASSTGKSLARLYFVLGVAGMQLLISWFLGVTTGSGMMDDTLFGSSNTVTAPKIDAREGDFPLKENLEAELQQELPQS